MNPFHELEAPIYETAMAAQLLASLCEDANINAAKNKGPITIDDHEWELISFLVYDLCKRTYQMRKDFQMTVDDEAEQAEVDSAKAA